MDYRFQYLDLVEPFPAALDQSIVTIDQWLGNAPPAIPRRRNIGSDSVSLFTEALVSEVITIDKWLGSDDPTPARRRTRSIGESVSIFNAALSEIAVTVDQWDGDQPLVIRRRVGRVSDAIDLFTEALAGETITIDKWLGSDDPQPISRPERPARFHHEPVSLFGAALSESAVTVDQWDGDQPLTIRRRQPARFDAQDLFTEVFAAEIITIDKWLGLPSFPVMSGPARIYPPCESVSVFNASLSESAVTIDMWLGSEPPVILQRPLTHEYVQIDFQETLPAPGSVTIDMWLGSEPPVVRGLPVRHPAELELFSGEVPHGIVNLDQWYTRPTEPPLARWAPRTDSINLFSAVLTDFPPVITIDMWLGSEPVVTRGQPLRQADLIPLLAATLSESFVTLDEWYVRPTEPPIPKWAPATFPVGLVVIVTPFGVVLSTDPCEFQRPLASDATLKRPESQEDSQHKRYEKTEQVYKRDEPCD